jgi:hypothetical protein
MKTSHLKKKQKNKTPGPDNFRKLAKLVNFKEDIISVSYKLPQNISRGAITYSTKMVYYQYQIRHSH